MKKLLSILAAVGLTATASTAVVACTTTVKASKGSWTDAKTLAYKDVKITAIVDIAKDNGTKALTGYGLFDKDGKAVDATVTVTPHAAITKEIKKGKSVDVDITIAFTADQSKADAATYYLNDATKSGKDAKKGNATELKAPKYTAPSGDAGKGGDTGNTTPTVDASQSFTVTTATGSVTVKGTNLSAIKAASDVTIKKADQKVDSSTLIDTVVPAQDGKSVVITFKGLTSDMNGDYTVTLGTIATTISLKINISNGGGQGGDTTPTVTDGQTVTVTKDALTATINGTNLSAIKAASDVKLTASTTDNKPTTAATADANIDTVVPAQDGKSVVITFKALTAANNGDYTITLGTVATTVKLTINIAA